MTSRPMQFGPEWMRKASSGSTKPGAPTAATTGGVATGAQTQGGTVPNGSSRTSSSASAGAGTGASGLEPKAGLSSTGSGILSPSFASPGAFSFAAAASGAGSHHSASGSAALGNVLASAAPNGAIGIGAGAAAAASGGTSVANGPSASEEVGTVAGGGGARAWSGLSLYGLGRSGKSATFAEPNVATTHSTGSAAGQNTDGAASSKRKIHGPLKSPALDVGDTGPFRNASNEPARGLNARGSANASGDGRAAGSGLLQRTFAGSGAGSGNGPPPPCLAGAGDKPRGFQGGVLGGPIGRTRKDSEGGNASGAPRSPNPTISGGGGDDSEAATFGSGGFGHWTRPSTQRASSQSNSTAVAGANNAIATSIPNSRSQESEGISGSSWAARYKRERAPGEGPMGPPADHSGGFGKGRPVFERKRPVSGTLRSAQPSSVTDQHERLLGSSAAATANALHQQQHHHQRLEDLEDEAKILDALRLEEEERQAAREVDGWSPDRAFWYYKDYEGRVQGPFDANNMQEWYAQSYFKADLLVRRDEEDKFRPLGEVIKEVDNSVEPFLLPPPKREGKQQDGQQQEQLQEHEGDHLQPQMQQEQENQQQRDGQVPAPSAEESTLSPWPLNDTHAAPPVGVFQSPLTMLGQHGVPGFPGQPSPFGALVPPPPASLAPANPFGIPGEMSLEEKLRHQEQYVLMMRRQHIMEQQLRAGMPLDQRVAAAAAFGMVMPHSLSQQQQQQQQQQPWTGSSMDAWGYAHTQGLGLPQAPFGLPPGGVQPSQLLQQQLYQHRLQQQQQHPFLEQQQHHLHLQDQLQQLQQHSEQSRSQQQRQAQQHNAGGVWNAWGAAPGTPKTTQQAELKSVPDAIGTPRRSQSPAPEAATSAAADEPAQTEPVLETAPAAAIAEGSAPAEPELEPQPQPEASGQLESAHQLEGSLEPGEEWVADQGQQQMQIVTTRKQRNRKARENAEADSNAAAAKARGTSSAMAGNLNIMSADDFKKATTPAASQQTQSSTSEPSMPSTPAKPAPWAQAAEEKPATLTSPSLREIQAAELKAAESKKALERQAAANRAKAAAAAFASASSSAQPITMSWGLASVPSSASKTEEASASPTSGSVGHAWSTTTSSTTKKTLAEIQEEERKRAQRAKEIAAAARAQQAAAAGGKAYADLAASAASRAVSQPNLAPAPGWSVVGASGKPVGGASSGTVPSNRSSDAMASPQRSASAGTASVKPAPAVAAAPPTNGTAVRSSAAPLSSSSGSLSSSGPSPEFVRYTKEQLKGLSVNVDDFVDMLLSFPLDPSPDVVEIIAESIYANSSTLDGRRFAAEFVAKRKMDAQGCGLGATGSSAASSGASGLGRPAERSASDVLKSQPSRRDTFAGFQVVQGKGGKKKGGK
ncbi:hypothetical protein K437DRAFT_258191 [Tilletiaria anomala UBC 951]|uniref:GYF domain-containing protein n=1 Tax=Tilletiaria anomala (strain ATCC 24038 / CBS 436.72 / UBC 951) TaxID=1037660 RepID=A0A066VIM5_TILAU|nr:uncharacterized protein K437DRAFT_258191 [Tilletiaria anomala UBC 951]KDN41597.1 hypothetical protein K437DRAFT_258191 [Tilletiaria anomala UBC 951]